MTLSCARRSKILLEKLLQIKTRKTFNATVSDDDGSTHCLSRKVPIMAGYSLIADE
jgi:hypothetical protein